MFNSKPSLYSFGTVCLAVVAALVFLTFLPGRLLAESSSVATQAIQNKYQQMNGQNVLGKAQSEVRATYDKRGYFRDYERGAIYWHQQYGTHEVHGAIFRKWYSTGRAGGLLGYPLTDETRTSDGKGRYSKFEHGVIYWHPSIGNTAYEVHGGILAKWTQLGSERSRLGYPITDEHDTPNRNGRMSLFQYGAIYWIRGAGGATVEYSAETDSGLHFRNNTANTLWLALGFKDSSSSEWVSKGWYEIKPGQTRTLVNGDLTQRYYYFYAENSGSTWEGDYMFWIRPNKPFGPTSDTLSAAVAQNQGYTRKGFREIDSGSYKSYTYTLYP